LVVQSVAGLSPLLLPAKMEQRALTAPMELLVKMAQLVPMVRLVRLGKMD